ncbi:MAG: surface-adhesin E family protein [Sphingosinicella sp.]
MSWSMMIAALAAQAPVDARWERVFQDADGISYIDPGTIAREGGRVLALFRVDTSEEQLGTRTMVMHQVIDCTQRTYTVVTRELLRDDGSSLGAMSAAPDELFAQEFVDYGHDAAIYRRVCGPR